MAQGDDVGVGDAHNAGYDVAARFAIDGLLQPGSLAFLMDAES